MEKTKTELLKEANDEMSEHCFKAGRLRYSIKIQEERINDLNRELANLDIDWIKIDERYRKALEARQKEVRGERPDTPETSVEPQLTNLTVVQ